jgi:UDP-N-acetyl-D-mannosaminuronic acid dehydrogenase
VSKFKKICVVGLGYIGLPTATVFADQGVFVHGVDVKEAAVAAINSGNPHITEPELDVILRRVLSTGKFKASMTPDKADAFILAVPTPFKDHFVPDISYIEKAARAIAPYLEKGNLVVLESTSPVGTTERLSAILAEERPDLKLPHMESSRSDIQVAHCPERVLPGKILFEVVHNARVIGGITPECANAALSLYQIISRADCHITNARTAELVKLSENAFRDVNIAFANELNYICDQLKIDVWELISLANLHPRVNILKPGPGVGGHCIAVDPWFIVAADPANAKLIRLAREINNRKPHYVVDKVKYAAAKLKSPKIACLGLSYKADIDDFRESPSLEIVEELAAAKLGALSVVEPHISELPKSLQNSGIEMLSFNAALREADIVVLLVDHKAFLKVDRELLKEKIVIDTRGVW